MCGYLSGLSAPSVTEMTTTLLCSPRSNSAGQTRLPTFSMNSSDSGLRVECVQGAAHHVGVEVAARSGVDLHGARAGGADSLGVEQRLLIAFDDGDRTVGRQLTDGALEKGGLAGAR